MEIFENVIFQPRLPLAMNSIRLSKKSMQLMLDGSPVTTFMKLSPLTIFQNFVELSQMQFMILNAEFLIDLDKRSKLQKLSQVLLTLELLGQTAL